MVIKKIDIATGKSYVGKVEPSEIEGDIMAVGTDAQTFRNNNGIWEATSLLKVFKDESNNCSLSFSNFDNLDTNFNQPLKIMQYAPGQSQARFCDNKLYIQNDISGGDIYVGGFDGNLIQISWGSWGHGIYISDFVHVGDDLPLLADENGKLKLGTNLTSWNYQTLTANLTLTDLSNPNYIFECAASYDVILPTGYPHNTKVTIKNNNLITDLSNLINIKFASATLTQLTSQSTVTLIYNLSTNKWLIIDYKIAGLNTAGSVKIASQSQFDNGTSIENGIYLMPTVGEVRSSIPNHLSSKVSAQIEILDSWTNVLSINALAGTYIFKAILYIEFNYVGTPTTQMNLTVNPSVANAISYARGLVTQSASASNMLLTNNIFIESGANWGGRNLLNSIDLQRASTESAFQVWTIEGLLEIAQTTNILTKIETLNGDAGSICKANSFCYLQKMNI